MHQTIFLTKAIDYLNVQPGQWYVDATFGAGGHAQEILNRGGKVLAIEYDESAYQIASQNFMEAIARQDLILINDNFDKIRKIVQQQKQINPELEIAGVIYDLGTSTDQLMSGKLGLSVYEDGPLDMRLDRNLAVTARDLLMALSEKQLMNLFFEVGGELEARKIARAIINQRTKRGVDAFKTSGELATLIHRTKRAPSRIHPATKVFQALRITVNDEIGNLERSLPQALQCLKVGGRLVTIAFHDGEDRPIKHYFQLLEEQNDAILILRKPLVPDSQELKNPRSRSAKMRVIEKIN